MVLKFREYQIGVYGFDGATAAVDLLISGHMLHFFITNRHKAATRTGNIMTSFIRYFFFTGAAFSAIAIASSPLPSTMGWSQLTYQILPFVMQICLMSTINGRDDLLDKATQRMHAERPTMPASVTGGGESTKVGNSTGGFESKLGKNSKYDDDELVSQI